MVCSPLACVFISGSPIRPQTGHLRTNVDKFKTGWAETITTSGEEILIQTWTLHHLIVCKLRLSPHLFTLTHFSNQNKCHPCHLFTNMQRLADFTALLARSFFFFFLVNGPLNHTEVKHPYPNTKIPLFPNTYIKVRHCADCSFKHNETKSKKQ